MVCQLRFAMLLRQRGSGRATLSEVSVRYELKDTDERHARRVNMTVMTFARMKWLLSRVSVSAPEECTGECQEDCVGTIRG
jgi:hypothetical protein